MDQVESMLNYEYDSSNSWKGLKTLPGYKKKSALLEIDDDQAFAEELDELDECFDTLDVLEECNTLVKMLINQNDETIVCTEKEVNIALSKVNPRQSSASDQLCNKVIKECWLQMTPVILTFYQSLMDNIDMYLAHYRIGTCTKKEYS